ncbi:ABC transporter permease subunit [Salinibacterium sp. ZJ77]|uniref:ABC transporter permease subunit n=1 Tax=Salinibacterium sp. ZJ77 TaxID=2708337 RepID=UPI0014225FB7|nr:ABC transporter permease subunit [Salinibacterium sp. ZJ77]
MTATIERPRPTTRLTTGGIIRSEWVKLVTLRSTWWCLGLIALMTAGVPVLIALVLGLNGAGDSSVDYGSYNWTMSNTVVIGFTVLIAAVLGCLVITGEYGTGMIRSSMAAAPGRISTVLAKALVIGLAVFVVGAVSLVIGALISGAILSGSGYTIDFADTRVWLALLGAAGYPALLAVFSVGVGTMLRNSAGSIATVLGLLLVVPTVLQLVAVLLQAQWAFDLAEFLPSVLGGTMSEFAFDTGFDMPSGSVALEPWAAAVTMAGWSIAALIGGSLLIKSRDV